MFKVQSFEFKIIDLTLNLKPGTCNLKVETVPLSP